MFRDCGNVKLRHMYLGGIFSDGWSGLSAEVLCVN